MKGRWATVRLGGIVDSLDYGHTASATGMPVGPKFLRITDIQDGRVDWRSVPYCQCSVDAGRDKALRPGDIVFARTGATTGKSFLISTCPERAVFASYLIRIRPSEEASPSYLYHFFQTPAYWRQISLYARGAAQAGVNASTLREIQIPLPPLPEQRRIAAILDQADALRTKRRQALARLDTLTQSIFLEMFGDPATNPRRWDEVEVGEICSVKGGKRLPKGEEYSSTPTRFRYIRVTDIRDGAIAEDALVYLPPDVQSKIARYTVSAGDVVISIAGTIGLVAPVRPSLHGVNLTENAAKLTPRAQGIYNPAYLSKALQSGHAQTQIGALTGQVTIGKLALFRIEKIRIQLPPTTLQDCFAKRVQAYERIGHSYRASLAQLDSLFASLQYRAFRGEL